MSDLKKLAKRLMTLDDRIIACMKCGMCQAVCPMFGATMMEADVARGKLALVDNLAHEMIADPEAVADKLGRCLLCGSCEANCPSGVKIMDIFMEAREIVNTYIGLHPVKKMVFRALLPYPGLFNFAMRVGAPMQRVIFRSNKDTQNTACAPMLNFMLGDRHIRSLALKPLHAIYGNLDEPRVMGGLKVAFFPGCMGDKLYVDVSEACIKVLHHHNVAIYMPSSFACCGIPALSSGDAEGMVKQMAKSLAAFGESSFDYVLTACSSCTSTIKELWPRYAARLGSVEQHQAEALAAITMDINEFLVKVLKVEAVESLPGAKTVTYHDSCHLKKALGLSEEPRTIIKANPNYKLVEMKEADRCCGCGACAARCPKSCISMEPDDCGFLHPTVDASGCVGCGACDAVCPALNAPGEDGCEFALWAKAHDVGLLDRSSSGGVFGLLAGDALSRGGVVAGAAWTDGCRELRHVLVEDRPALGAVMRSKYVQSAVGRGVFEGVRAALREGRPALFAGTACQVAGMRSYLGKLADSDLFLGVDVICHGVPSPELWSRWVDYRGEAFGSDVCDVNMRSKTTGWLSYSAMYKHIAEKDNTGDTESQIFGKDWYMKAFLANASLRSSCLACPAKRSSGADITLGDFWGFQNTHPEVDNSKGVSAVLCNTEKGVRAFEAISGLTANGPATLDGVIAGNPSLVHSVTPYPKRDEFLNDVSAGLSIPDLMDKWDFRPTLWQRVRGKLGGIKRRLKRLVGRRA